MRSSLLLLLSLGKDIAFAFSFIRPPLLHLKMSATEHDVETEAFKILQSMKMGKTSVAQLLGPLYNRDGAKMAVVSVPPGSRTLLNYAKEEDVSPLDGFNSALVANVHPPDYQNPTPLEKYDLVVIGAGVSGLLSVIMAKALGKKAALIERHYMGGDCLNVGCVPSKALIACAKRLEDVRGAAAFGVCLPEGAVTIDFPAVMQRMRKIRAEISVHDSVARYARDFCEHVFLGDARLTSPHTVDVCGRVTLHFDHCMVATGASAALPAVPGLKEASYLTNANFFNLEDLPPRMCIIGAGPIGLEKAQAMQRFGSAVTVFEAGPQLLPREDPEAAQILQTSLERDGVKLILGARIKRVEPVVTDGNGSGSGSGSGNLSAFGPPWMVQRVVLDAGDGREEAFECEALLVAAGRTPNVFGVGLEEAGVDFDNRRGVVIDDFFRTSASHIFACGDCCTPYRFTHSADWQARLAIRNMFLGDDSRLSDLLIPWCTYTEPEVAHVGMYDAELKAAGIEFESYKRELAPVDRCRCEGIEEGFVKLAVAPDTGVLLGATVVGPTAGDLISELTVCMQNGVGCGELAGTMHPYPTVAEAIRQAAGQFNKHYRTPAVNRALELLMAERAAAKPV